MLCLLRCDAPLRLRGPADRHLVAVGAGKRSFRAYKHLVVHQFKNTMKYITARRYDASVPRLRKLRE